jgi:hypothetical protein
MAGLRELKVYVSQGLGTQLDAELQLCGCSLSGFVRAAIVRELVVRSLTRKKLARSAELPGQTSIDGQLCD